MLSEKSRRKSSGFTLIELLISVFIIALLVGLALASYRSFEKETELTTQAQNIVSVLKSAKNKTLASEDSSRYGVYFENNKYILFKGFDYLAENPDNQVFNLPNYLEINEINLTDNSKKVVFDRISGIATTTGGISLRRTDDYNKVKYICISKYIVNLCQSLPQSQSEQPPSQFIANSRHVHFDLGWSIKNATLIKFYFINNSQTETVDMADYFNSNKTKFDWRGTFTVENSKQEYRIHTHNLTDLNTLLCIHRDNDNNKEVIIYIYDGSDKEIVHYYIDITGNVGPFGGTAYEQ